MNPNMLLHVRQSMSLGSTCEQAWHKPSTEPQVRDAQAMIATQADVKEYPDSYVFVIDMPGLKLDGIKVEMEHGNMLLISGERKREEEKEAGYVYLIMEWLGKLLRKFMREEEKEAGSEYLIRGERKREEIEAGAKYLRMERVGKFLRKFQLPENANTDAVSAVYQDGVLTVTVQKRKYRTFQVQMGR